MPQPLGAASSPPPGDWRALVESGTKREVIRALREISGEPLPARQRAYQELRRHAWAVLSAGAATPAAETARFVLCGWTDCAPTPLLPPAESLEELAPGVREIGPDLVPPQRISGAAPQNTPLARRAGVGGPVVLKGLLNPQGAIDRVWVVSGLPLDVTEAMVASFKTWKFTPATLDGEPVAVFYQFAAVVRP